MYKMMKPKFCLLVVLVCCGAQAKEGRFTQQLKCFEALDNRQTLTAQRGEQVRPRLTDSSFAFDILKAYADQPERRVVTFDGKYGAQHGVYVLTDDLIQFLPYKAKPNGVQFKETFNAIIPDKDYIARIDITHTGDGKNNPYESNSSTITISTPAIGASPPKQMAVMDAQTEARIIKELGSAISGVAAKATFLNGGLKGKSPGMPIPKWELENSKKAIYECAKIPSLEKISMDQARKLDEIEKPISGIAPVEVKGSN